MAGRSRGLTSLIAAGHTSLAFLAAATGFPDQYGDETRLFPVADYRHRPLCRELRERLLQRFVLRDDREGLPPALISILPE